jgi:hypothetical protein
MTRKHFEAIADAIAYEYAEPRARDSKAASAERATTRRIAAAVGEACAQFNPNFDRAKFLTRALPETINV